VVYADVDPPLMSAATSFASMLQPLASAAGIAASALLLRLSAGRGVLTAFDMRITLLTIGAIALGAVWPFLAMADMAGAELSGRQPLQRGTESR
jgi:hypothetical protein